MITRWNGVETAAPVGGEYSQRTSKMIDVAVDVAVMASANAVLCPGLSVPTSHVRPCVSERHCGENVPYWKPAASALFIAYAFSTTNVPPCVVTAPLFVTVINTVAGSPCVTDVTAVTITARALWLLWVAAPVGTG